VEVTLSDEEEEEVEYRLLVVALAVAGENGDDRRSADVTPYLSCKRCSRDSFSIVIRPICRDTSNA
jgi:hypothetical protein